MERTQMETQAKKLQSHMDQLPSNLNSLELILKSSAKHMPTYVKILESHIQQLASVLESDNHNHQTIASINLAEPVKQLIEIFETLEDDDIQIIEDLALAARHWQKESVQTIDTPNISSAASEF